jgi:F420-non-reducing hydrogenase small subunit
MKPRLAFIGLAGCGGCEASLLDLGRDLFVLADGVEIVYWPLALDHKKRRLEELAEGGLEAAWINGAIRTGEQEELARLLRRKARRIIAQGTCAALGGVAALATLWRKEDLLAGAWQETFLVKKGRASEPGIKTEADEPIVPLPALTDRVRPLSEVIPVDYVVPGCPPPPSSNLRVFRSLLDGSFPPDVPAAAEEKALCYYCPRKDSQPEKFRWPRLGRVQQKIWDPELCFLAAQIPCLGPATLGDCGSRCIRANMPCRGCFGPLETAGDQGARVMAFLASLLEPAPGEDLESLMDSVPDPVGLAYLYSLGTCPLFRGPGGTKDG